MKHFFFLMIFASLFTGMAFAEETATECPMMREANERSNPKANLDAIKIKSKKAKAATAQ